MSSFIDLKHIPCPAGNRCSAFQCLFGHEKDKPAPAPEPKPADDSSESLEGGPRKRQKTTTADQDIAQTRVAQTTRRGIAASTSTVAASSSNEKAGLPGLTRPISPPALKRPPSASSFPKDTLAAAKGGTPIQQLAIKRAAGASSLSPSSHPRTTTKVSPSLPATASILKASAIKASAPSSHSPLPSLSASTSTSASAATTSSSKALKPRKAEALNPRLIKSSPSSYETRIKLLRLIHDELNRLNNELRKAAQDDDSDLVLSRQELIWEALDLEESAAVNKPTIYSNSIRNLIMKMKRTKPQQWREERRTDRRRRDINNKKQKTVDAPKEIKTGLKLALEVELLRRLVTPIHKLDKHGYVSVAPSEDDIAKARDGMDAAQGWEKCDRCERRFQVFPGRRDEDGELTSGGECHYHYGKTYLPERQPGDNTRKVKRYLCCGQEIGDSTGCIHSSCHVFKVTEPKRLAVVFNFAKTPANPAVPKDRAVCFDCEMCYTTNGLELIRLTATSWPTGDTMLDVLVLPAGTILDLNSRYSGVWPDDMAKAEIWTKKEVPEPDTKGDNKGMKIVVSPEAARDLLFSLVAPETPLIGHGLENDLNATRIIHPTVIDTVLLYPHKAGLPFRHGLKRLMQDMLNRKIQVETGGKIQGHDSGEDARAAGELVHLKVLQEWRKMQLKGWKVDAATGDFVPPAGKLTEEELELAAARLDSGEDQGTPGK